MLAWTRQALAVAREDWRRSPGVRHVLVVNVVSAFNAGLLIPILPLFLISKGFSLLQLGGIFVAVGVGALVVQLVAGRFPRAFGNPVLVMALAFVPALTTPLYLLAQTPLQFVGLAALGSFAGAASAPGVSALIAQAAPVEGQARVFAYLGMLTGFAYAAAILVAYSLASKGFGPVFALATLVSLGVLGLTGWVLWRAHAATPRSRAQRDALTQDERQAFDDLAAARKGALASLHDLQRARQGLVRRLPLGTGRNVALLSTHLFLFGLSLAIYPIYFPIYLQQRGLPPAWIGPVIAASWIAAALFQLAGPTLAARTGRPRAVIVASLLACAALNVVMGFAPLALIISAWVVFGVVDGVGRPLAMAMVAQNASPAGPLASFSWTEAATSAARILAPYALALVVKRGGDLAMGFNYVALAVLASALPFLFLAVPRRAPAAQPATSPSGEPA